jgi:hypothetical protein
MEPSKKEKSNSIPPDLNSLKNQDLGFFFGMKEQQHSGWLASNKEIDPAVRQWQPTLTSYYLSGDRKQGDQIGRFFRPIGDCLLWAVA